MVELLLVGYADCLQPLQPPFAVQHGVVVPRSVQHVGFVQLALKLALLLLLEVGIDVLPDGSDVVIQGFRGGEGAGLVVEFNR